MRIAAFILISTLLMNVCLVQAGVEMIMCNKESAPCMEQQAQGGKNTRRIIIENVSKRKRSKQEATCFYIQEQHHYAKSTKSKQHLADQLEALGCSTYSP